MARIRLLLATTLVASAAHSVACTPPTTFTTWPEQVAHAYGQSQAVFIARAVRRQSLPEKDGYVTTRVYIKPMQFFKGGPAQALAYIDKQHHTCDQRHLPNAQGEVLVFASAQGELLRAVPEYDRDSPEVPPPYASALQQVRELSKTQEKR